MAFKFKPFKLAASIYNNTPTSMFSRLATGGDLFTEDDTFSSILKTTGKNAVVGGTIAGTGAGLTSLTGKGAKKKPGFTLSEDFDQELSNSGFIADTGQTEFEKEAFSFDPSLAQPPDLTGSSNIEMGLGAISSIAPAFGPVGGAIGVGAGLVKGIFGFSNQVKDKRKIRKHQTKMRNEEEKIKRNKQIFQSNRAGNIIKNNMILAGRAEQGQGF